MNLEKLVQSYLDAWNRHDTDGLLALMHEGAAYYDAYWSESCVGRDLAVYFNDYFQDEPYEYRQVGDVIAIDGGVIFRYNAHKKSDSKDGEAVFNGAEVLTVRDGKILTVSDHYCDPELASLTDVAALAATRHGERKYATSGLGSLQFLRIKHRLLKLMNQDNVRLDPTLTSLQLADKIGCSVDHLFQVMNIESEEEFRDCIVHKKTSATPGIFI